MVGCNVVIDVKEVVLIILDDADSIVDGLGVGMSVTSVSTENVVSTLMIGDEDGLRVGDGDGPNDGLLDGLLVRFVGLNVGESVGSDGKNVGLFVGDTVGFGVGIVNGEGAYEHS